MNAPVNLAVIGCGRVAQAQHLRELSKMPGVRLTALADADEGSLKQALKKFAPTAQGYASYQNLLEEANVDAVVICLPTALHADAAVASFHAGKSVYLEKPIGVDMQEAQRVMQAQAKANTHAQMGFNYRYHPAYTALRDAIRSGRIGTIAAGNSIFCSPPRELQGWKASRQTGGGVLLDLFVHHADLTAFLLDQQIVSVFAAVRSLKTEDDTALITVTTDQGLALQTTVSSAAAQADRFAFTGDKGTVEAGRFGVSSPVFSPVKRSFAMKDRINSALAELAALPARLSSTLRPLPEPSYRLALSAFVRSVGDDTAPTPGLASGYQAAAIVQAAEQSAKTGAAVMVQAMQPMGDEQAAHEPAALQDVTP